MNRIAAPTATTAASQPGPQAAHDGEHQPGREPDARADEGQHGQHVGELPARRADIELRPVKNVACSLKACSHSSKEEGRAIGGSLGLVMMGQI